MRIRLSAIKDPLPMLAKMGAVHDEEDGVTGSASIWLRPGCPEYERSLSEAHADKDGGPDMYYYDTKWYIHEGRAEWMHQFVNNKDGRSVFVSVEWDGIQIEKVQFSTYKPAPPPQTDQVDCYVIGRLECRNEFTVFWPELIL